MPICSLPLDLIASGTWAASAGSAEMLGSAAPVAEAAPLASDEELPPQALSTSTEVAAAAPTISRVKVDVRTVMVKTPDLGETTAGMVGSMTGWTTRCTHFLAAISPNRTYLTFFTCAAGQISPTRRAGIGGRAPR